MQRRFLHVVFLLLTCAISGISLAQAPQQFNYQAVIRDNNGQPMANKPIQVRLRLKNGGLNGAAKYTELRTVTTNEFGLATVSINGPGADQQQGSMGLVEWATGSVFLQVEVDHDKDGSFTDMGATQILSAPYAMYATPLGSAAGDLGGKYPNPSVSKLQGQELDLSAQKYHGYTLKWDQVNNKWVTGKDEDGGPDFFFKATKNSNVQVEFKPFNPIGFFLNLNQYPMIPQFYNQTNLLRFPHKESDMYGLFDDSVFTAPVDGMYEFEAVVHFTSLHWQTVPPLAGCWMGMFKNGDYVGMSWNVYKSKEEADLKPARLKRVLYLQQGDKILFRLSHNYTGETVLIGFSASGIGDLNAFMNYESMYVTGRRIR